MTNKKLNTAEKELLEAFLDYLRDEDAKKFNLRCEMLDGLVQAAKAQVQLDKLVRR